MLNGNKCECNFLLTVFYDDGVESPTDLPHPVTRSGLLVSALNAQAVSVGVIPAFYLARAPIRRRGNEDFFQNGVRQRKNMVSLDDPEEIQIDTTPYAHVLGVHLL